MNADIDHILLTEEEIHRKVEEMAQKLNEAYRGKEVLCVCILKGSTIFFSDLTRKLDFPVQFEFMIVSSYASGTVSQGVLNIKKDLDQPLEGKHIIVVEDILDTGNTLYHLKNELLARNPESFAICCLLDKPSRREVDISADYIGFEIPNEFVVGYGLDFDENYRQLPYIGVLKSECYEK